MLDPAASDKSAKCDKYFTPEIDGLKQSWDVGRLCSVIRLTDARSVSGSRKLMKKLKMESRSYCSFLPEQTQNGSIIISMVKRKFVF